MTQFVSNPFAVLGKSDPTSATPSADSLPTSAAPSIGEQKKSADSATPSHPSLTFLHSLGVFLESDLLPLLPQIALAILERKL